LPEMLSKYLGTKDCGLFLDLALYNIISTVVSGSAPR
jgi:hypothetical protein